MEDGKGTPAGQCWCLRTLLHYQDRTLVSTRGNPPTQQEEDTSPGNLGLIAAFKPHRVMDVLESIQRRTSDRHRLTKQGSPGEESYK